MKSAFKVLGISVLAALIVFSMADCKSDVDDPPAPTPTPTWDFTLYLDNTNGTLHKNTSGGEPVTAEMAAAGAVVSGSSGAWVLTLTNFTFETTAIKVLEVPNGTTIALNGTNMFASKYSGSGDSYGIRCYSGGSYGALTINGSGTLNTASGNTTDYDFAYNRTLFYGYFRVV